MTVTALFGLSALLSMVGFAVVAAIYVWPHLPAMRRENAFTMLTIPHIFRFEGLSFLVPGVVSPSLPSAFAVPAAYGDLVACFLALAAVWALTARAPVAIPLLWVLNLWGTADLLNAIFQGVIVVKIDPGALGATFFIPTVFVPLLLLSHATMFWLLIRSTRTERVVS